MTINNKHTIRITILICTIIATIFATACATPKVNEIGFAQTSVAYDSSMFEFVQDEGAGVACTLTFYYSTRTSPFTTKEDIKEAYFLLNEEPVKVQINDIVLFEENPITKLAGKNIYFGQMLIEFIDLEDGYYKDTKIKLILKNNKEITCPIGVLSYRQIEKTLPENYFVMFCEGVVNTIDETPVVNGATLRFEIPREMVISKIDLGLKNIGVNQKNMLLFTENDYKTTFTSYYDKGKLNELIPNAYKEQIASKPNSECNITIPKGIRYLYIPFTKTSHSSPQLVRLFANIAVQVDGVNYSLWSNSFPFLSATYHSDAEIEKIIIEEKL